MTTNAPTEETAHPLVYVLNAVAVVSVAGSIWTIVVCSRGDPKLLKRQLFHQALGTLLFNLVWLSRFIFIDYGVCSSDLVFHPMLVEDKVLRSILHGLWFVSCLAELHIAASVAAAASRKTRILSALGRWLTLVWLLSLAYGVLGLADRVVLHGDWNVLGNDPVGAWMVVVCFVSTFLLYVFALSVSTRAYAPDVVLRRMRDRAMVYPALFMLTGIPTVLRYFHWYRVCSVPGMLSMIFEFAEGALNAVVLFALRGVPGARIESVELSNRNAPAREPRTVGFSPDTEVQVSAAPAGSSFRRSFQWREGNDALDWELEVAEQEQDEEKEQEQGQEKETLKMWEAYVGTQGY